VAGKVSTVGELLDEINFLPSDTPVVTECGYPVIVGLRIDLKKGTKFVIYGELRIIEKKK
jgi:hypothetical protein